MASAALITLLSALPYVSHLGFYSDDWGIIAGLSNGPKQTLASLIAENAARPIQAVYLAGLFHLFGLAPLGYHIVNTAVLAVSAALLCLLLLRLSFSRAEAFATTVVFVMLPQLSTVRVWYSAFQIPLSMMLALASMHCQLSYARRGQIGWLLAAIATAIMSVGAYEIFAPLIAGFALALILMNRSNSRLGGARRGKAVAALILCVGLVAAALGYKLALTTRAGPVWDMGRYLLGLHQFFRLDYDWRVDSGLNVIATPMTHFWGPIRGWWKGAGILFGYRAGFVVTAIAATVGAIIFWRLIIEKEVASRDGSKRLFLLGAAAFALGNATFLIVPSIAFTSTGMDNRAQVAAALGVACIFVASISFLAALVPSGRPAVFASIIALLSAAALARLSAVEAYWAQAPKIQNGILDAARADLQHVPSNSTVILDGFCPYYGPAVVFEASWDVGGALSISLGRPMMGDVVSPRMSVMANGLRTSIYKEPSFYHYGPRLYVYNPAAHLLVTMADAGVAKRYFSARKRDNCGGFVARGVEV